LANKRILFQSLKPANQLKRHAAGLRFLARPCNLTRFIGIRTTALCNAIAAAQFTTRETQNQTMTIVADSGQSTPAIAITQLETNLQSQ